MTEQNRRPLALILLDGWGTERAEANTPFYDEICRKYPMTTLPAGTSAETGYRDIVAGRSVVSNAERIDSAIRSGEFFKNPVLADAMSHGGALHLVGILSGSERHASMESLFALLKMAKEHGVGDVFIHGFLDGLDVPPQTAEVCIEAVERETGELGVGRIASLCGRFFAMDMHANWERTARAFTLLMHCEGDRASDAASATERSAMSGISEEFMPPTVIGEAANIRTGDTIVFFNHRSDGMRQLARSITTSAKDINVVCLTEYDEDLGLPVAFSTDGTRNSLNEVLAAANIRQIRISQAEGRGHTDESASFAPAGDSIVFRTRSGVSSGDEPEMSSFKIANELIERIDKGDGDFFAVTLPALDILASIGDEHGASEATQYIDTCLGGMIEKIVESNGVAIITSPNSGNGAAKVPFHLIANDTADIKFRENGTLSDIAPTVLAILGIEKTAEMSGNDLRSC
jgi:2,3-bisphosphoglycerate-independent phosphoglycerate mutase